MKRRPPGELGVDELAERLGSTPARVRRSVADRRWDQVPQPAEQYGLDIRWQEGDVERFLSGDGASQLRLRDVAERIGRNRPYLQQMLARQRYDLVPEPDGRDSVGWYWTTETVDQWLAAKSERLSIDDVAQALEMSVAEVRAYVDRREWDRVPPPDGGRGHRRFWRPDTITALKSRAP